ncbi:hypothetical protein [uncultured Helicobacter sp.]|uniref:hypothetical protein n=1 Tax=uncultured Helicobacter sp. TaxID=175537 RepID=UPI0037534784
MGKPPQALRISLDSVCGGIWLFASLTLTTALLKEQYIGEFVAHLLDRYSSLISLLAIA